MHRASRIAIASLVIVGLAAALAWGIERIAPQAERASIERELSAALGRDVRLGGTLRLDLFPRPALEATDVSVANLPGRSSPYLVHVDEVRLALALWPLLRQQLRLVGLVLEGVDVRLESDGESRADALAPIARLTGEEPDTDDAIAVRIDRLAIRDARIVWLDVAIGEHTTLGLDSLVISAADDEQPIEWRVRGSLRGGAFDLAGRGGTLAALLDATGPWPVSLEGSAGEAKVRLDGQIERPTRLEGLDLALEVELPEVGALLATGPAKPELGRARLRGHLVDPGGEPGLDRLVVESDSDAELRLRVQGSVRRLADASGIELDAEIDLDRLRLLEPLVGRALPEGALHAKLAVSDQDGTLGLSGEAHAESRDGSLQADVSGGFGDLSARDALDAQLRVIGPDLATLGRLAGLGRTLPSLGPVVASGRLRGTAGVIGIEELALDAGSRGGSWLSLRGSLRDLRAIRGVALTASGGSRSLVSVGRTLGLARPLPDVGPLDLRVTIGDARGPLGVERFELRGGSAATLSFDVSGSLADLRELDALAVEGRVRARDTAVLGSLLDVRLPAIGPAIFEGRLRGSNERLETDGTATLGQTQIEGSGSAELAGSPRPRVSARLRSAHLRLEDLGLGDRSAAGARDAEGGGWSFGAPDPLPFEELRRIDAQLDLQADRMTAGSSVDIRDARVHIGLEDGHLEVSQLELGYQGGRVAGDLRIDARTPDPRVALRANATALDLVQLGVAIGQPGATGSGRLDLALDLASRGRTPDALREDIAGTAAFAAREWSAASELARRFLLDLTRSIVPDRLRAPDRVGCFRGALGFAAGKADVESLVLAGEHATVVGTGSIDLVREQWNLELVPEIHDPGLLEVASAVRVTGPLDAPRFAPVRLDLVAGTLRGLVRGALLPARKATAGAQRVLGSVGKVLAPLHTGLGLGARASAHLDPAACVIPVGKDPPGGPR